MYFCFQDDIEKIVAEIELEEKKRQEVVEITVPPPSGRANFTLTAHPDKEELILLGGEYFNGKKVHYYNLGSSSALRSLPHQFWLHAHWSTSYGVDTQTVQREILLHIISHIVLHTDLHQTTTVSGAPLYK